MKRIIVFGIILVLLAVYSSTTIVKVSSAAGASIVISPDTTAASPGSTFMLTLTINNVNDMRAWNVGLVYQKIMTLSSVDTVNNTIFTDGDGLVIYKQEDYNSSYYYLNVARTTIDVVPGMGDGSGPVAKLNFIAVRTGETAISFVNTETEILNSNSQPITPVTVTAATITIAPPVQPRSVGGTSFSVAKRVTSLTPYIGLALAIATTAVIATTIYLKSTKRRKEKQ